MDSLTLNSLYDEAAYRANQQPMYGAPAPNPFEVQDPFAISSSIAPPVAVQMNAMTLQPAPNPFGPYQPSFQPQPHVAMGAPNPFADAGFGSFPAAPATHPQHANPFGSAGLL